VTGPAAVVVAALAAGLVGALLVPPATGSAGRPRRPGRSSYAGSRGVPVLLGAAASAAVMSIALGVLQRRGRLSYDTSIGLLFVGMLALGVIVISHSGSFATDATAILFGDILAVSGSDVVLLAVATAVGLALAALAHRPLVALALDARVAAVLGLRPALAQALLVGLVTLAVVVSYQAVGSLLVVGLLVAPAVAASQWTTRIPTTMALAAVLGVVAVQVGLLVSWYAATAAGSSIAMTAVGLAVASWALRSATRAAGTALRTPGPANTTAPAPPVLVPR